MCKRLQVKYTLFLSDVNETWIFSTDFRKKTQILSFIKIRPVRAMRTDGHTDMKLTAPFRYFANAPKKLNNKNKNINNYCQGCKAADCKCAKVIRP
jgi:hypothetical protein